MSEQERRVFREKPHPRALILVGESEDALAHEISGLFPVAHRVENTQSIQQKDWDVLITTCGVRYQSYDGTAEFSGHVYVVAFGGEELGSAPNGRETARGGGRVTVTSPTRSAKRFPAMSRDSEFYEPRDDLPGGVADLVKRDLLRQAHARSEHSVVWFSGSLELPNSWQPFLESTAGALIAGRFTRPDGGELWTLPSDVELHAEWIRAALRHWRTLDAKRFRDIPGWERRREWLTPEEAALQDELDALRKELQRVTNQIEARCEALEERLAEARVLSEQGRRKLLTASGGDLVHEVQRVMESFGFHVLDVDDLLADGDEKREDLRVSDDDGWTALVEVKGHLRGGAKANDLLKVGRHQLLYEREKGSAPNVTWYVVNQFAGQDPEVRQPVLSSNPEALHHFIDQGGVAIDTTSLFRLTFAVESGQLTEGQARDLLKAASGVFEYR